MHNVVRWFLLWLLFPMVMVAADPPPPLVRSVLTTNLPAFGSAGQALFRTPALPYLAWSNLVWELLGTNALTAKLDSNWWWTAYGSKVLTNSGAFIGSASGFGTNTTFYGSDGGTNWTTTSTNGWLNTNTAGGFTDIQNGSILNSSNVVIGTNRNDVSWSFGGVTLTNAPLTVVDFAGGDTFDIYDNSTRGIFSINQFGNVSSYRHSANGSANGMTVRKDRNGSSVNNGDEVLSIQAAPYDGTSYGTCASIVASVNGTTGTTNVPLDWIFRTGTNATYYTERMRITSKGEVDMLSNVVISGSSSNTYSGASNYYAGTTTFGTNNNVVVTAAGKIGIGTNNPQAVLDIFAQSNGPSQYILRVGNGMVAGASNVVVVSTNNRVGILSSSPSSSLDIVVNSGTSVIPVLGFEDSGGGSWGISLDRTVGTVARGYIGLLQGISGLTASNNYFWQFNWNLANTAINTFKNPDGNASPGLTTFNILQKTGQTGDLLAITSSNATMGNLVKVTSAGFIGLGTNSPQSALHVTGDNSAANVMQWGTTNRPQLGRVDTNGNMSVVGTITPTNGIINQVSNSFIANLTIVTNNPQLYCLSGTNQLITLPDCTKIPTGQIYRFSSTNGYGSVVITNATGAQTIRDGTSLDYKVSGVFSVAFFSDGTVWWIASKAKTIWPNASWSTSTNVPMAVTGSNYITFDTLETSNAQGISLTNGYQIYIRDAGQYLLTISLVTQVGHNGDTNRVWLQQSAQNVPRTRSDVKIAQTTGQQMMTVNFIVPVVTNLTWFGLCCRSTDTGSQFVTGAGADATMPAMPSAIVTVNKISDTFP